MCKSSKLLPRSSDASHARPEEGADEAADQAGADMAEGNEEAPKKGWFKRLLG